MENSPSEKEVFVCWIMKGDHAIKDNERFVGYTIIQYLNHIEPSKSTK